VAGVEQRRQRVIAMTDQHVTDQAWGILLHKTREAAETYLRWERDLKPRGFRLAASVVDFPDGMPGEIGLFLNWGGSATGSGQSTPAAV
jgi:hypothetical protein